MSSTRLKVAESASPQHFRPRSHFEAPGPVDLSQREVRERLSASGLRGFFDIAARWGLRDDDARALLGGVSSSHYYAWKKNPARLLDTDQLTRVSYTLGIYQALHRLYEPALADEWMRLPNSNPMFSGQPPLAYLVSGGIPALHLLRQLLEARAAGA